MLILKTPKTEKTIQSSVDVLLEITAGRGGAIRVRANLFRDSVPDEQSAQVTPDTNILGLLQFNIIETRQTPYGRKPENPNDFYTLRVCRLNSSFRYRALHTKIFGPRTVWDTQKYRLAKDLPKNPSKKIKYHLPLGMLFQPLWRVRGSITEPARAIPYSAGRGNNWYPEPVPPFLPIHVELELLESGSVAVHVTHEGYSTIACWFRTDGRLFVNRDIKDSPLFKWRRKHSGHIDL